MATNGSGFLKEALQLDANKETFAAFMKYLSSVSCLCADILEISKCDEIQLCTNKSAERKMKLIKECVERLECLYEEIKRTRRSPGYLSALPSTGSSSISVDNCASAAMTYGKNDPLQEAAEKNRILITRHRLKMEKVQPSGSQLASMNLALQRQMIENITLAKQTKLQQQVDKEKCKQSTIDYLKKNKSYSHLSEESIHWISEVKAFENDCPELRLYAQYLYEKKDTEPEILKHYLQALTDYPEHPFVTKLKETGELFVQDLHTKNKIDEHSFIVNVNDMADHIVEQLSLKLCQCLRLEPKYTNFIKANLVHYFYRPIMFKLVEVYRLKNSNQQIRMKTVFENPDFEKSNFPLQDLQIGEEFLVELSKSFNNIKFASTPQHMLSTLVNTCQKFSTVHNQKTNADDIINCLITLIMKSKDADVVAYSALMEDFISAEQVTSEDGYCLTSLQAGTNYLLALVT